MRLAMLKGTNKVDSRNRQAWLFQISENRARTIQPNIGREFSCVTSEGELLEKVVTASVAGDSLWGQYQDFEITLQDSLPNKYFPHVHRNISRADHSCPGLPWDRSYLRTSVRRLSTIWRIIEEASFSVEPVKINGGVFGELFRQVLVLSSMEVEAHFRKILLENGYSQGQRWTFKDYARLEPYISLSAWTAQFALFSDFGELSPFKGFGGRSRTNPIWWKAYTNVKHDSSRYFSEASLENAISSFAAATCLLAVQYGRHVARQIEGRYQAFERISCAWQGTDTGNRAYYFVPEYGGTWEPMLIFSHEG